MSRDYRLYLDDIISSVIKIEEYTRGMGFNDFIADNKTIDAVVRNLEIIGEAAKNLPDAITGKSQDIEWKKIKGLRDILAHEYFGVINKIIWDIVVNKLTLLKESCLKILDEQKQ